MPNPSELGSPLTTEKSVSTKLGRTRQFLELYDIKLGETRRIWKNYSDVVKVIPVTPGIKLNGVHIP